MKKIDMINELEKNREYVENIINSKNNKFTFRNHNYNYNYFLYTLEYPLFFEIKTKSNEIYLPDRIKFFKKNIEFEVVSGFKYFLYNQIENVTIIEIIDLREIVLKMIPLLK